MKRTATRLLPLLFLGMLMHSGCAKQELVKKDEPIVPAAATPQQTAQSKPAAVSEQPVVKGTVTGASIADGQPKAAPQESSRPEALAALQRGLEKVYFDFDAATLTTAARKALTRNFDLLRKNPQAAVRIEGSCDERGSDEYNLALGERRAQAAARYLTDLGIAAERLSTISYGREKPADPGHDEAAWAKNRRDEFVVVK